MTKLYISIIAVFFAGWFFAGWAFGMYNHPYEKCERRGVSPDDIAECVWLLQNQPSLR